MEISPDYLNKFRPRAAKKNQPRSQRDELLDLFLARLNASRLRDGFPKITHARLAGMLKGRSEAQLYQLFKECDTPGVRSFGAMLMHKLKQRTVPTVPESGGT